MGRTIRKIHVPPGLLRLQQIACQGMAPPVANLLGTSWIHAQWDTAYRPPDARTVMDPTGMTTVEQFLRRKLALAG